MAVVLLGGGPAGRRARRGLRTWPLRLAPALTSTFGESRSRAFHAGIDLKTWGETGHPVQALADGYIWRVRTSPWGYGRALYQKLADGRTCGLCPSGGVCRAHGRTRPASTAAAADATAWICISRRGKFQYSAARVIAWSGESGAGPPHLHLELRDANNVAINPSLAWVLPSPIRSRRPCSGWLSRRMDAQCPSGGRARPLCAEFALAAGPGGVCRGADPCRCSAR